MVVQLVRQKGTLWSSSYLSDAIFYITNYV